MKLPLVIDPLLSVTVRSGPSFGLLHWSTIIESDSFDGFALRLKTVIDAGDIQEATVPERKIRGLKNVSVWPNGHALGWRICIHDHPGRLSHILSSLSRPRFFGGAIRIAKLF
jgi:hypothetical protein